MDTFIYPDLDQHTPMKTNLLLVICCFLLLNSCKEPQKSPDPFSIIEDGEGTRLDSLLTPYVQELLKLSDNQAGLAIGVANSEKIIYARAFGYSDIEKGERASLNTVFHMASLSKPFAAAAVVKLVQEGKLNLDDRLIDHIPEFTMKGDGYTQISLRHILTHSSGIPRHVSSGDWENPSYGPKALEKNLSYIKDFELDFEPGSQYNYSNSAFDILGIVVSRASGMSFHEYVRTHILEPAGMINSFYKKPANELPAGWAKGYSYGIKTTEWNPYPYTENYFPSSGLKSSLLDMSQWGMLHLNKGKIGNVSVLNETYFDTLTGPQYDTPWGDKMGLSWFLQSYLDRPIIMHTGSDTGFEAMMYVYPEDGYAIIVMANRDFARTGRLINATSEILFGQQSKTYQLSARYKFAKAYRETGLEAAKQLWSELKTDSTDMYDVEDEDILTAGAVLENAADWADAKAILEFYNSLESHSTYAWRLLGNANLGLGDSTTARKCYEHCLEINPDYEKAKKALEAMAK